MRFLITGDSWIQGEWDGYPDDYQVTHSGIHQYLIDDGHEVLNVGQGGYNNLESIGAAESVQEPYDHLVLFYTDPLRQADEHDVGSVLPRKIIQDHNRSIISKLQTLKKLHGYQITVIGGCAKFQDNAPNIDFVVPSICKLLVPGFVDSEFMTSREWEVHFFKQEKNFSIDQKRAWLEVLSIAQEKCNLWSKHKEFFWPDGLHANRHGTKILYNYLKKLWFNESLSLHETVLDQ